MSENKPVKKFRAGSINVSIFKNNGTSRNGSATEFNTIALQRAYKDREGKWQNASSLRVNDLPRAVLLLQKAYEELVFKNIDTGAFVESFEEEDI